MPDATDERHLADSLASGDILGLILMQHAELRDLLDAVSRAAGDERRELFERLKALLSAHEAAEQIVLRPSTRDCVGIEVAAAREAEEKTDDAVLDRLSSLDPGGEGFSVAFATFARDVAQHAEAEEEQEHPLVLSGKTVAERIHLGTQFSAAYQRAGGPDLAPLRTTDWQ